MRSLTQRDSTHERVGEGFWEKDEELGHLYQISFLWEVQYLTTDTDVIKVIQTSHIYHLDTATLTNP